MLDKPIAPATRIVRRQPAALSEQQAEICVLGAGISGISAALEAARLGRKVLLVDALPTLGGQAVNSIIGTFCGLFSNGTHGFQLTHGIADDILRELGAEGALHYRREHTTVVLYDEVALGRWVERSIAAAGVTLLLGAVLREVRVEDRRIAQLELATRYGDVRVRAAGFVDATGDAALAWQAGQECREPAEGVVYGSQMMVLEQVDEQHYPTRAAISERLAAVGERYGLIRRDGFAFAFPGRGTALVNMNHIETPLDPVASSATGLFGKEQADRSLRFLQNEFPAAFGRTRVRAYGLPGIRQTRWIVGRHHLTVEEVRAGTKFADSIARTAWPIEQHHYAEGYVWEPFDEHHLHYVPFASLTPPGLDNLVAAGRCIDADSAALSSVRVMGPCIAMGAAAAHALDLAGSGSVHQIEIAALRRRLAANVDERP
ncbi:MAG TPA: FAD-dependent oxidoreductase [Stellaceae bacterium]|nr:FAD-dependent oxidoreductase [Stellaceae bacterium]